MYEESSWTAWILGLAADGILPVALFVLAGVLVWRGSRPKQAGLRFVGATLALWALTDLLAWPTKSRFAYDSLYNVLGSWFGANYAALSDLIGSFVAAVCLAILGYGGVVVVNDLADEPSSPAS